ncbi:host specificity protein [Mesorhizobium silamurunense]|uniref:host specificity protein n=1 Tax=Mesorhizobium silamurunense TaxID=499528 RepID=UPI001FE4A658|nr:host specificity protein [Mesorhizobium silamurunense]
MDNTRRPLLRPETGRWIENLTGAQTRDPRASSSLAPTRPYSLASQPPIEELDKSSFAKKMRDFYSDEIKHIADNPQEYSPFVSSKAERTATLARLYGSTDQDSPKARYFSYDLGETCAGLLRTEGGFNIEREQWRDRFPGRKHITSIVDLRVTHPLVENAGDILLEHQLRLDGERPLIMSRPALPDMEDRLQQMGFVDVGQDRWVLDPTQHPDKWTKNSNGEWQRAGKPGLYLSKSDESESDESVDSYSSEANDEDDSSDDDPAWYLERYMNRLAIK